MDRITSLFHEVIFSLTRFISHTTRFLSLMTRIISLMHVGHLLS
jgi:hypothetical protein